jgi:enediyne biosynthesis protein E4
MSRGKRTLFGIAYSMHPQMESTLLARALPGNLSRGASPGPVAVADIDGNGRLDLFVGGRVVAGRYPEAAPPVLFRHDASGLTYDAVNSAKLADVGMVSGAAWSDLDGDGFPELILACEWGPIRIFSNQKGHLTEVTAALGLSSFTGWWNGVATGDFDGDGRVDIVATNWGLNTGYHASPERPERLYHGDYDSSGTLDLIEAYAPPDVHGARVPRRTLHALGQAFPILFEQFPSHADFGQATIEEILDVVPLKGPPLEAVHLASTVFLNRGSHFVAAPLPPEAQWSPAHAAVVADFDGDGHEDLFLSQNFFAVRPEWPRLDRGTRAPVAGARRRFRSVLCQARNQVCGSMENNEAQPSRITTAMAVLISLLRRMAPRHAFSAMSGHGPACGFGWWDHKPILPA